MLSKHSQGDVLSSCVFESRSPGTFSVLGLGTRSIWMEFKTVGQEVVTGVDREEKESWDRAPRPSRLEGQRRKSLQRRRLRRRLGGWRKSRSGEYGVEKPRE